MSSSRRQLPSMLQGVDPEPVDGADSRQSENGARTLPRYVPRQEVAGHSVDLRPAGRQDTAGGGHRQVGDSTAGNGPDQG